MHQSNAAISSDISLPRGFPRQSDCGIAYGIFDCSQLRACFKLVRSVSRLEQLRRESFLESFSALNECDKFLLRALGSDRTRGREFTTAIKISLKLFMGNAYTPFFSLRRRRQPTYSHGNDILQGESVTRPTIICERE